MASLSLSSSNEIEEDVRGVRRRCVSLSSVDSEPIPKRRRTNTHDPDAQTDTNAHNDTPTNHDVAAVEDGDTDTDENGHGSSAALRDVGLGALSAAHLALLRDTPGTPPRLPINSVSEAAVATITAVMGPHLVPVLTEEAEADEPHDEAAGKTDGLRVPASPSTTTTTTSVSSTRVEIFVVVADHDAGALVLEAGTRVCLADGTIVGVIVTVMGPVTACAYAIAAPHQQQQQLQPGMRLCYDLTAHRILYDPLTQCDTRRGTDASYINDEELPHHARPDFSDDEVEREWKTQRRMRGRSEHQRHQTHAEEELSSDEEPVEVDWEKINALETCLRESQGLTRTAAVGITPTVQEAKEEKEVVVEEEEEDAPCTRRAKLVIPPWISY